MEGSTVAGSAVHYLHASITCNGLPSTVYNVPPSFDKATQKFSLPSVSLARRATRTICPRGCIGLPAPTLYDGLAFSISQRSAWQAFLREEIRPTAQSASLPRLNPKCFSLGRTLAGLFGSDISPLSLRVVIPGTKANELLLAFGRPSVFSYTKDGCRTQYDCPAPLTHSLLDSHDPL